MTKVLLVEDHPDVREILRVQLEWMGVTVITAKNGKEGVEAAIAERPDLILMNGMMPEMTGWEATQILRATPETRDIPILAMTALFRLSDLQAYIDAGCNDYIVKPFSWQALRRKINALIRKQ
jgi:two-component system cell cycle response regulator DivK